MADDRSKQGKPLPWEPLPDEPSLQITWPTPNQALMTDPDSFFARTRVNPDYGKPGWSRDCGNKLHQGCDIAPVRKTKMGKTTTVQFTLCETGEEFTSEEETWIPHDPVFAVVDGTVVEAVADPAISTFGNHVVIGHRFPDSNQLFYTLYAHLEDVLVTGDQSVCKGQKIGTMGKTSSSADAVNWMEIAPHLHLEVWNTRQQPYDPVAFLQSYVSQSL